MKLLYTEGNFLDAGQQVLFYFIAEDNVSREEYQHEVQNHAKFVSDTKDKMFDITPEEDHVPPVLGDVIWTHDGGNKWIGHCIVQTSKGDINLDAMTLCIKSIQRKCFDLNCPAVSMPLLANANDLEYWNTLFPIIENGLGDVQGIVYVKDNRTLDSILTNLPGKEITAHFTKPQIRFK